VWIGDDSFGPHGAALIPPHHEHVAALMADLVKFTQRADLASAHAQFETIHPSRTATAAPAARSSTQCCAVTG
jgi:hypothetical protein